MNLPHRLTLMRIILILPTVILLMLADAVGWWMWLAAGLSFGAAAITDAFDGSIARKRGLVTDFGKLMDPVADKLLVTSVFTCFVALSLWSPWVLIAILAREFLITSIRMVSASSGRVIAANIWGKVKTVTQMTAIVIVMCCGLALSALSRYGIESGVATSALDIIRSVALWLAALATVKSGAVYVYQNRELFRDA